MNQPLIVSTERLGIPGDESGRIERRGLVQRRLVYPADSDSPTATCHLQLAENEPALCGYAWEGLVRVPDAASFDDIAEPLRCSRCLAQVRDMDGAEAAPMGGVPIVFHVAADFPSRGWFRFALVGGRFSRLTLDDQRLWIAPSWSFLERLVPVATCAIAEIDRVVPFEGVLFQKELNIFVKGGAVYEVFLGARDRDLLMSELARRGVTIARR